MEEALNLSSDRLLDNDDDMSVVLIGTLPVGHIRLLQLQLSAFKYVRYVVRISARLSTAPICWVFFVVPLVNDMTC